MKTIEQLEEENKRLRNAAKVFKSSIDFYKEQEKLARERLAAHETNETYQTVYINYMQEYVEVLKSIDSKLGKISEYMAAEEKRKIRQDKINGKI